MAIDIVKSTKKRVETSKKKLAKTIDLKSYRKLAVNFLILTINLIIIILYFSLSQAKVVIVPARDVFSHSVILPITTEASETPPPLSITGSKTSVTVSHSQNFSVDETSTIDKNAEGVVTIRNTTSDRSQIFVANTRFQNEAGIEIKTKKQVQVAPNTELEVEAYASNPGASGEVRAESGTFQVVALPYLKDRIYAEVSQNFSNGTAPIRSLTPSSFNSAKEEVEKALREKGAKLLAEASSKIPPTQELALSVTELSSTANPGDAEIESFSITAQAEVSIFTYDETRAREIVEQELVKRIPADKILVAFEEGSYQTSFDEQNNTVSTQLSARIQPKIPDAALNQEDIIGLNQDEVREHFTKITGIRDVEIKFWPFWVRSVPNLKDHVDIEIKR